MISFFVPGKPVGKQRPRFGNGNIYTPQRTKDYEENVGYYALEARNAEKIFRPLEKDIEVSLMVLHKDLNKMPDLDNIAKSILDAMNKIIYVDDKQVSKLECERVWITDENEKEGVRVFITGR